MQCHLNKKSNFIKEKTTFLKGKHVVLYLIPFKCEDYMADSLTHKQSSYYIYRL
jgi:hypothetical protein